MELIRKHVQSIRPYIAGKPIEETKRELGLKTVIKLASNENPLGVSPKAVAAIRNLLRGVNRYPDSNSFSLKERIARRYSIKSNAIVLGNGSDELIDIVIKTFVEDDENIVTADVTFLEYNIIAVVNNKEVITAPLKNYTYDLPMLLEKINDKTKLVFIANPNNPTGTYINSRQMLSFLNKIPDHVVVVLDEAYDTFIDVKDFPNSLDYVRCNRNVIVLKTFSKAYGLAGLRIGYAIARADFSQAMEKVRQPFNVNLLAQVGAASALNDSQFLKKTKMTVIQGKRYFYKELARLNIPYIPSVANFVLVDTQQNGYDIFQKMLRKGVIVRDMRQYGLDSFVRITIGTPAENKRCIQVLKTVLNG